MGNNETHHEPIVYGLYNYLADHHLGIENGIKKPELANIFNLSERELRKITKTINESSEFNRLVSTTHSCYMCRTKAECEKSIRNTYRTALALLRKAKQMERKVGLNGQIKLKLGDQYNDFISTFEE